MKLPIRKKDSSLKTMLSTQYNETITNLIKERSLSDRVILLEDKYYKREVTSDLIRTIAPYIQGDSNRDKAKSEWKTVEVGRGSSRNLVSTPTFVLPTKNRFNQLGN